MKRLFALAAVAALLLASPALADPAGAVSPGTVGTQSFLMGCYRPSSTPAPAVGQQMAVSCDANGNLVAATGAGTSAQQVQGTAANGAATVGNPVLVAGSDGANARAIHTETNGNLFIQGNANAGSSGGASDPIVRVGGFDGANNRALRTDAVGNGVYGQVMPGTSVTAASGNVANASAAATLPGVASKTTYIQGFQCSAAGATAASVVSLTVAGVITGTLTYTFAFPAGATIGATPLVVNFAAPVPASATNTSIVVTLPAGGAGNTNASCNAQGFQL